MHIIQVVSLRSKAKQRLIMPPLKFYAGPAARNALKYSPFSPNLFTHFLGASGGPKWFVLAGLDKALFGSFFNQHCGHMNIIGSSAGAFRAACFAQDDPVAAIDRLANHYSHTVYSAKATPFEISEKAKETIAHVLTPDGIFELMNNDTFTVHFLTARCKGLMKSDAKLIQSLGLLASMGLNKLARKNLSLLFDRVVFSSKKNKLVINDPYGLKTQYIKMGFNTVTDAVLASGSIPLVMSYVRDVVDAPDDFFRDGGILDYHFDFSLDCDLGLTLYPHFYPHISPGWFDKGIKRPPHKSSFDKVIMLVPSDEFIGSLPYQKIPDRKDFEQMQDNQRIKYWQTVIKESERLGDYFLEIVSQNRVADVLEPFPFEMCD